MHYVFKTLFENPHTYVCRECNMISKVTSWMSAEAEIRCRRQILCP